jgi:hypothetical protein
MDASTEQIAFTGCTFKDCNIGSIDSDEARGIVSKDNTFERPLDDQRKDFEERLVNRRSNIAGRMTIAAYCGSATSAKVNGRADFSFGGNVSPPPQCAGARHRAAVWKLIAIPQVN